MTDWVTGWVFDRDNYPVRKAWVVCPDCGVGKGSDHKNGCPRGKKNHASFRLDPTVYEGVGDPRMKLTLKDMYGFSPRTALLPLAHSKA